VVRTTISTGGGGTTDSTNTNETERDDDSDERQQTATEPADVEPVPAPSRRARPGRRGDLSPIPEEFSVDEAPPGAPGRGVDTTVFGPDSAPPRPQQSMGQESRRDLAVPGRQAQLEAEADTDLVDATGDAVQTAADNPKSLAAATVSTPLPGDELLAGLGLLAGGALAANEFRRRGGEIPVPSEPLSRGQNELPVGETTAISQSTGTGMGRPEIDIPKRQFRERPEISVSETDLFSDPEIPIEGTQSQPEIPVGIEAGQQVTGQQRRRRDREQNPFRRRQGASEEELKEILDIDPTTLGEQEQSQNRRVRERDRFVFPGDSGTATATEQGDFGQFESDIQESLPQGIDSGSGTGPTPLPPAERQEATTEADNLEFVNEELRARPKPNLSTGVIERTATDQGQQFTPREVTETTSRTATQTQQQQAQLTTAEELPRPLETTNEFATPPATGTGQARGDRQRRRPRPRIDFDDRDGDRRDEDDPFGFFEQRFEFDVGSPTEVSDQL
jgi:hypothetical protein